MSKAVTYADDLVFCCKHSAEKALGALRDLMQRLKLRINEHKTRVYRLPEETFDFLGYTIGRCYSPQTGKAYLGTRPSKKAVRRVTCAISEMTSRKWVWADLEGRVERLNRLLVGWAN